MSTSDAGELELRVVGGETATPLYGTAAAAEAAAATQATTAREPRDETFGERFEEKHHDDKSPAGQSSHQSASTQKETHKALILGADRLRKDKASSCGDADVQIPKPSFTSCLSLRLSSFDRPQLKYKRNLCRLNEPQQVETKDSSFQVNGRTSSPVTSIEAPRIFPLSEAIPFPAKKEDEVITADCNELEITRDLSRTQAFSNSDFGTHKCNGLHMLSCGSQPRACTGSLTRVELKENIKDLTKPANQADLQEVADDPSGAMLSSTVVTVLAPHWSGRLRRSKRFDGTGNSEAQANAQDGTSIAENRGFQQSQSQRGVESVLTDGAENQLRVPFSDLRRNTVGWSTKSEPLSLESKREMIKTVSLDVNSGRMDNRKRERGFLSPLATNASPVSQPFAGQSEQRKNLQTVQQGGHSSLSSKPTTSNVLLSLRRGSNGKNLNATSALSEVNPSTLSNFPSDQSEKLFTTPLSQSFLNNNNNEKERPKQLISPSSLSYRTTETGPVLSPSSSGLREQNISDRFFFSTSLASKDAEGKPFSQQSQTINRIQSSLASSQSFLGKGLSESQQNCWDLDGSTNLFSETSVHLPRQSPYNSSAQVKTHSFPKRTTLKQTSWWKQVAQDGNSLFTLEDTTNNKDKTNTTLVPPSNKNSDISSPSQPDNKRVGSPVNNNRDNNNTKSVCTGNNNLFMRTQGGTQHLKQRNTGNSPDHDLHRPVKQHYGSNLNNREYQKPHSVSDILSSSKISRAIAQTTLSQPKDPSKYDVSDSSANMSEVPPTLQNPRSSNTPTESSSKYKNNYYPPKTNNTPISPHSLDSQRFTSTSLSLDFTSPLSGKAHTSQNASDPQTSKIKSGFSYYSHSVSPQTSIHSSSYATSTGSSSQKTNFTSNSLVTPLGFERSYASIPKPFHPKTVSSLISTVSSVSKRDCSSIATASNSSSSTTGSLPVATTASSSSLLIPTFTSAITSSPTSATVSSLLTPPLTPNITSPSSETSSPKEDGKFSSSPKKESNKLGRGVEKKRVRRVTWDDSVDLQHSEPITVKKPESSQVQTTSQAASRYLRNAPSIFSFLRSNSSTSSSPLCSPKPKTSSIEVGKAGKCRSLSSDSADLTFRELERNKQRAGDAMIFNLGRQDSTTPMQERTLSVESGTVQFRSSAPLSLPPDFPSGYKVRYSSPPYSTLMSTRMAQGETKTRTPRSPLFSQPSQSNCTPHLSVNTDPVSVMTLSASKPPISPTRPSLSLSIPLQKKPAKQESPKIGISETDQASNNHSRDTSEDRKLLLVDNRVQIRPPSLQGDKAATYVTETLVYSIQSKVDKSTGTTATTPNALQHTTNTLVSVETKLSQQSHRGQNKGAAGEPCCHSGQSSSSSSSAESQSQEKEDSSKSMKETLMGKSKFFSVDVNNEQNTKRSRFALKKSVSTPNSSLSRSESDRAKSNNKVDQVFSKLKQKFSTRRSASQAPSVSGSSDVSTVSDVIVESRKPPEETVPEKIMVLNDNKETEGSNRWTQNRYILIPSSAAGNTKTGNQHSGWSEKSPLETDQDMQNACAEKMSEKKVPVYLTVHSPTVDQFDLDQDEIDYNATNQHLSSRDPSPSRNPASFRRSTPSPRSPFSPFSSLSPLSPFSSSDITDDSVFYSPKLQRRRESFSPCEPGEGISLGVSRRSRASTGPPCASPGHDKENLASSYADLKYGIEPGKSFSVSSVLSSRPSGPGRISTGSRFMSVGDLSQSALSCGSNNRDLDQWSVKPDWSTAFDCKAANDGRMSYAPGDPGQMRSRSLPRSLTRCLANWSSGDPPQHVNTSASKPTHLRSPNMNNCQFAWDTEGPPTPPPTPPLSPVSRRMSRPPSLSSPTFPSSSGALQSADSQSSRGHLPSRGYVSSLSTFDESSDSNSDTTTDDEYYLEIDDDGEKETEL